MNSYEDPSLSYECDREAEIERLRARLAEAERLLRSAQYDPYEPDSPMTDDEWCAAWRAFFGIEYPAPPPDPKPGEYEPGTVPADSADGERSTAGDVHGS
jgi:hypothetical protein